MPFKGNYLYLFPSGAAIMRRDEERTKIIQKWLLNPTADVLKAMSEPESACTGKIGIISAQSSIYSQLDKTTCILFHLPHLHFKMFFFSSHSASNPTESLEQIVAFDVEKLLSKSAVLSEDMLLHVWQSLTKDWGEGFCQHSSGGFCAKPFNRGIVPWNSSSYMLEPHKPKKFYYISFKFLPLGFLCFDLIILIIYCSHFLGSNSDRIGKSSGGKSC